LICAIVFATPLFIFFGNLSDKIGRKWIIMLGLLGAVLMYRPIYRQMLNVTSTENSMVDSARTQIQSVLTPAKEKDYGLQTVTATYHYGNGITEKKVHVDTLYNSGLEKPQVIEKTSKQVPTDRYWILVGLIFLQILFVTMSYGPIAAFLVEMFPTKIRYTSMSLPYHLGNGVFGGLTPFIAVLMGTIYTTDKLVGLWYPISVATLCLIIGSLYLNNKANKNVND
jgi:MFS family permease